MRNCRALIVQNRTETASASASASASAGELHQRSAPSQCTLDWDYEKIDDGFHTYVSNQMQYLESPLDNFIKNYQFIS